MSAFRVVIAIGMAAILGAFTFCASYTYLSTYLFFLVFYLVGDAPLDAGPVGSDIHVDALLLSLLAALTLGLLVGTTTFILVLQFQKSKA